ncbi:hypothetical protein [Neofamilia massiliensis]|nr:hypothetical protein [Neofamilia massiliensis]
MTEKNYDNLEIQLNDIELDKNELEYLKKLNNKLAGGACGAAKECSCDS